MEASQSAPVANVDQAAAWDGEEGERWARHAARYDTAVSRHWVHLSEAAAISPGERVLDIGCGCGESTRDAARAAAPGTVLGIDLSSKMLAVARERSLAEELTNVEFVQGTLRSTPSRRGRSI